MQVRIPLAEIREAWPDRLHALFAEKGIRLEPAGNPFDVSSIRFSEPVTCRWDAETGDMIVDQP
jgi:hypothetical protein